MVHAEPQPTPPTHERRNKNREGGRNQKERLFRIGNTTSLVDS